MKNGCRRVSSARGAGLSSRDAAHLTLVAALALAACGGAPAGPATSPESAGGSRTAASCKGGEWSLFVGGQCLIAVQSFFPAKFGVSIPIAPATWSGGCAPEGACHLWVDTWLMDPKVWERIPASSGALPSTYDVIVFAPTSGNPWGHVGIVDRVEAGAIYIMDSNWNLDEQRASVPHTTAGLPAYGWFHLRSLAACNGGTSPQSRAQGCPLGDGLYCGGNHIAGDGSALYRCRAGAITLVKRCGARCTRMPDGYNDRCP